MLLRELLQRLQPQDQEREVHLAVWSPTSGWLELTLDFALAERGQPMLVASLAEVEAPGWPEALAEQWVDEAHRRYFGEVSKRFAVDAEEVFLTSTASLWQAADDPDPHQT